MTFRQGIPETVYEARNRFKKMLRNCPNHDIPRHIQVHTFYHGLTDGGKDKLDHLNGDSFLSRTTAECHNLLTIGVIEVDQVTTLNAKIDFLMQSMKNFGVNQVQYTPVICDECGESHPSYQCPQFNNNQGQGSTPRFQRGVQQQVQQPMQEKKPSLEETLMQFMGSLPSNIEPNPRQDGKAQCQAVTLCNGRELQEVVKETAKAKRKEKLHINIPFAEALEQIPSYVKFMKDILSKKRCLGDYETLALTEECSGIIQNKFPPKLKDFESFTIPCTIGTHFSRRALCDLRASINLMPYSIYQTLDLGEGVIEDVLVKVDKFIFPTDFVILDMEVDSEIPIILGRPFLATGRTLIDVQKGELTMRAMKFPNESDECFSISILDNLAGKESIAERTLDPLEHALLDLIDEENEEDLEVVKTLDALKFFKSKEVESLEKTAPSKVLKPSIEEPPL
ncbi:hypothetical protein CDL12_01597 [Handroanthus impetiginosus]|uniref:Uncharacterized protein n=1 Tax=Handroanthus impetiginosus TaxID=429701 RepID=A0A2G9I7D7_9LAMI|nr:hypothetical protein CDL12_01597 [Handroanthus impetiginosus]